MSNHPNIPDVLCEDIRKITLQESQQKQHILIDVRSEGEFIDGTIPGAISIPLFDNYERKVIGTIYKHGSQQSAIEKGVDFVQTKIPELMTHFDKFRNNCLTICCAKGGMRSRAIVNLLNQNGFNAYQLDGGYRKYRHIIIDQLAGFSGRLIVLHGLTGIGKTRIIERLPQDITIDLEDNAQHRSSLFGGVNTQPRNQKQFESELALRISQLTDSPYFIEGESNKIGRVFMPRSISHSMKNGIMVKLTAPLDTRISRIIEDYPVDSENIRLQMKKIFKSLTKRLGHETVKQLCSYLDEDDLYSLVHILLTRYYDVRYANMYKKYNFALELSAENIDEAVENLLTFRQQIMKG